MSRTEAQQLINACSLGQTETRKLCVSVSCPLRAVEQGQPVPSRQRAIPRPSRINADAFLGPCYPRHRSGHCPQRLPGRTGRARTQCEPVQLLCYTVARAQLRHSATLGTYTACGLKSDISRPWRPKDAFASASRIYHPPLSATIRSNGRRRSSPPAPLPTANSRLSSGHAKRVASRWRLPGCPVIPAPHLTPTPVTYYGSYKCNDYSCVTVNSIVDNEIRKSTLSGRVLPIIPVSHVTPWLTGR